MEIRYLGEQLKKGCVLCGEILHLSSFIGDRRFGLAILFSGIGDAAVNRFLAALNLPSIDSKTLKKREREKLAQQWKMLHILHAMMQ